MESQTKLVSSIEALVNILIGMGVAYASQVIVFPIVGIHGTPATTHLQITAYFTAISFARSYVVRRFFARGLNETLVRWLVK